MKRRLLWIVPKWPLPPTDGARVASHNLISALCRRGESIDLIAVAGFDERIDPEEARARLGVASAAAVRRGAIGAGGKEILGLISSALHDPLLPLTMQTFSAPPVKRALAELLECGARQWDALVYDGLHPAAHLSRRGLFTPPPGFPPVVYRAHNREALLWERKTEQERNHIFKGALAWQTKRVRCFERSLLRHSAGVAPVSQADFELLKKDWPGIRGRVVPIGCEFDPPVRLPPRSGIQIMYLGKLDWPPNREGLRWFLSQVWPAVSKQRRDLTLVIAGAGDGGFLKPYLSDSRIEFLGRIDSVGELYRRSQLAIVPVHYGSGTRVKAIEACRFAVPCLSTTVGVEGLGLTSGMTFIRADSREEWIDQLRQVTLEQAQRIGADAYGYAKQHFENAACARDFSRLLDTVIGQSTHRPLQATPITTDMP